MKNGGGERRRFSVVIFAFKDFKDDLGRQTEPDMDNG